MICSLHTATEETSIAKAAGQTALRSARRAVPRVRNVAKSSCLGWLTACLVLGMLGCSNSTGPPPNLTVVNVTDLGTIQTNPEILGRDGAYSGLFQGKSVWLYGDTFLAKPDAEGRTLVSDSWSWTSDLNAQDGITGFQERDDAVGAPAMILPESPQELAFDLAHSGNPCQVQPCGARWALWPSSIVADPTGNSALIFYMLVSAAPGNFNFQALGNSVATWQNFQHEPQRPTINPPVVAGHPDLLFDQNEPSFGSTAFVSRNTLYVYGCSTPVSTGKQCMLGKVAPTSVLDRSAWTYYAGNGNWSSQIADAVSVLTADNILSISWNAYIQQYVAVYSAPLSLDVMLRTSPNPEGPWSGELKIFTAMQPAQGDVYDAHAHSEYNVDNGRVIYISYSRSTGAFTSEIRLVSVELQPSTATQ
jgi:hypothetical protein